MRALYFAAISTVASVLPESSTARSSTKATLARQRCNGAALLNVVTTAESGSRAIAIILGTKRRAIQRQQPPEQQAPPSPRARQMRVQRKAHCDQCQAWSKSSFARARAGTAPRGNRGYCTDDP